MKKALFAIVVLAFAHQASASNLKVAKQIETYDQEPVDIEQDSLGKNYKGHSCVAVARSLKSLNPRKGEFETSSDFSVRMTPILNTVIYGKFTGASVLGFIPPNDTALHSSYNADTATMKFSIHAVGASLPHDDGFSTKSAIVHRVKTAQSSYIAANGYGNKVRVSKANFDVCAIAITKLSPLLRISSDPISGEFDMPVDEARSSKGNLSALYVGKLDLPFIQKYSEHLEPTIDNPYEYVYTGDAIGFRLDQIWIFNAKTGKIYHKIGVPVY